ncbi:hypothetical protein VHEMI08253 [[Torrubiella] hemipterigena]|uniref:Uncharacterized protein n=1 Tax=[Torrubiella] hemipterigena TaxID=1531966 RepID=A0A0A1TCU9_9HYPO|nr:hypothetical protein VHEMI08253 [[Torrubiella] hemipterigena]
MYSGTIDEHFGPLLPEENEQFELDTSDDEATSDHPAEKEFYDGLRTSTANFDGGTTSGNLDEVDSVDLSGAKRISTE